MAAREGAAGKGGWEIPPFHGLKFKRARSELHHKLVALLLDADLATAAG